MKQIVRKQFNITNEILLCDDFAEVIINSPKYGIFKSKIDLDDIEKVSFYKWCVQKKKNGFYVYSNSCRQNINLALHRYLTDCPETLEVDHINHDTLDNRKENLNVCSHFKNMLNKLNNKSGCVGVHFEKSKNRWRAQIGKIRLGTFENLNDAIKARLDAERIKESI